MGLGTENETTEFVDGMEQMDEALRSLAAILNRYHKAEVLIGVSSDGEPVDADIDDDDVETVKRSISEKMNTVPDADITIVTDDEGRRYIRISATGYDIPYTYDGWFRVRRCCISKKDGNTIVEWKNLMTCGMKRHRCRHKSPCHDVPSGTYAPLRECRQGRRREPAPWTSLRTPS